jgi:hypothetical protein
VIAIYLDLDLDLDLRWGLHKTPLFRLWRCCATYHIIEKKGISTFFNRERLTTITSDQMSLYRFILKLLRGRYSTSR